MNRLKLIWTGGWPIHEDDLTFIQDAFKEALGGLASLNPAGVGLAQSYIISGAGITLDGTDLVVAPGLVAVQGEIYYVAAQTLAVVPGAFVVYKYEEVLTYAPAGTKQYADTTTHDTHEIRRMQLVATDYVDGVGKLGALFSTFAVATNDNYNTWKEKTVHKVLHGVVTNNEGLGDWGAQTGYFRWVKNSAGMVTIYMNYSMTNVLSLPAAGAPIFNMPVGSRPAAGKEPRVVYNAQIGVGEATLFAKVHNNGNILIEKDDGTTWQGENGGCCIQYLAEA